jgi:hypothetical protein
MLNTGLGLGENREKHGKKGAKNHEKNAESG